MAGRTHHYFGLAPIQSLHRLFASPWTVLGRRQRNPLHLMILDCLHLLQKKTSLQILAAPAHLLGKIAPVDHFVPAA